VGHGRRRAHAPHIEQLKAVLAAIGDFADNVVKPTAG